MPNLKFPSSLFGIAPFESFPGIAQKHVILLCERLFLLLTWPYLACGACLESAARKGPKGNEGTWGQWALPWELMIPIEVTRPFSSQIMCTSADSGEEACFCQQWRRVLLWGIRVIWIFSVPKEFSENSSCSFYLSSAGAWVSGGTNPNGSTMLCSTVLPLRWLRLHSSFKLVRFPSEDSSLLGGIMVSQAQTISAGQPQESARHIWTCWIP